MKNSSAELCQAGTGCRFLSQRRSANIEQQLDQQKSRCVYCSTVIARNVLLIAVVQVSGWCWDHVSVYVSGWVCVWSSWGSEAVFVWQVGLELSPVCVNRTFTHSRKLPRGVRDDMFAALMNTLQQDVAFFFPTDDVSLTRKTIFVELEMFLPFWFCQRGQRSKKKKKKKSSSSLRVKPDSRDHFWEATAVFPW